MIQNSVLSHRSIFNSFSKFQRTASDHKFRTKSIRIKTVNQQIDQHLVQKIGLPIIYPSQSQGKFKPMESVKQFGQTTFEPLGGKTKKRTQSYKIIEKNYEEELNQMGVGSEFLLKLFSKKCQQTQTKYQEHKYQVYLKSLAQRLCRSKQLSIHQMGFANKSLQFFFEWYPKWDSQISDLDLTYAHELLKDSKMKIIKLLLKTDPKLMKLTLSNSSLEGSQILEIFQLINKQKQLFALDFSNKNSHNLNRFGEQLDIIETFFKENQSLAIAKLDNLHIRRQGFQYLCRGIKARKVNPLKILSLSDNHISGKIYDSFCNLVRSGLTHLDLSCNPLGSQFFQNLPVIKNATIKELNLGETHMNSQNLYRLFQKLEECKSIQVLKLDKNDFSHHWFGKIGQKLEINSSIQWLSLNNCQIKYFMPFFDGLVHNKYLKKLDASCNAVDCYQEVPEKIVNFFTLNKYLEEVRFRFCNLSEDILVKISQGVSKNSKLRVLDISENTMQDLAGTSILKMLEQNIILEHIGIQKLQLSQQMKKRIQMKLQENTILRQKQQFSKLKSQTKQMKAKDVHTWEDLQDYGEEENRLDRKMVNLEEKTEKLEKMIIQKKNGLQTLIKANKDQDQYFQHMIQERLRLNNEKVYTAQRNLELSIKKEQSIREQQIEEARKIEMIENKIRQTNEFNKKRENELEDKLRNHRYLQRKKSKNIQVVNLSPKKYSVHSHTHK